MALPIDTSGYYNKSVNLMQKYNNLNFVQRALNFDSNKTISDPENKNKTMSHRMSYAEADGQYYAYPEVIEINGKLQYLPGRSAMDYAFKNKQVIPLGNDKNFAEYFTTVGYKYKMSPDIYKEAIKNYITKKQLGGILKMKIIKDKKGGSSKKWIQKAVNPAHKGFCTPTTKSTCTPRRKALALRFKAMAKARKHEKGGSIDFLLPLIEEFKKGGKLSEKYIKEAHKKPGGSNVGKYPMNQTFAGPSGGAPKGSYPIGDIKHAKSALKLAHHAPNPSGIKSAVYKKYPQLKKHQEGGSITFLNELLENYKNGTNKNRK